MHHIWHLRGKVGAGRWKHLPHICRPWWRLLTVLMRAHVTSWRCHKATKAYILLHSFMHIISHLGLWCSSLKMWTVSVLLEAQRNCSSALNDRELMLTYLNTKTMKWQASILRSQNPFRIIPVLKSSLKTHFFALAFHHVACILCMMSVCYVFYFSLLPMLFGLFFDAL